MKSKLAIELNDNLRHWLETQTSVSGFSSASEYVEHLLMEKRRASMHELIEQRLLQALESNDSFELTEEHFAELDRKLQSVAKPGRKKKHVVKR
ncbi:MAG TPA: hypothetical protein PLX97_03855 [Gemmatales bacterium]|nr:hypothetical protein [Gemmatales bacterium]